MRASLTILSWSLMAITAVPVQAQEAQSVRLGQAALTYAAGAIRQEMPVEGVVNAITGDNQLAGNRMMLGWSGTDMLYLKLNKPGEAVLGDLFTVYRRARKVFHPITKQYLGYVINRVGVVKVVQVDPQLVGVQVVRSYAPISTGDPVVGFTPPAAEEIVEPASTGGEVEAMIVELQSDKHMSLVAQGNIVYLDKGQADGLHAGDCLEVFRTGSGLPERKIGEVKVLSAEAHTAASVISKAVARVLIGDRLRTKQVSTVQQALQLDQREEDLPAETVQPVTAANSQSTASAQQEPRAASRAGAERLRGGIRLNLDDLADQLEYESGEVKIKPAGMPILEQVAEFLTTAAGSQQVRVEGHSDNMEIGPSLKGAFPTNWELSKARAAEIVRYLVEKGGMDSAKLSAVGYGASRPVASNGTEAGRKKNRRIEIVLESPESDALPQSVKVPVTEGESGPAQYSYNQLSATPVVTDSLPAAPAAQPAPASSDVSTDRTPVVSDGAVPVAPVDPGAPTPVPGS